MREIRKSGSEGGVGFNPPFLPLSVAGASCSRNQSPWSWKLRCRESLCVAFTLLHLEFNKCIKERRLPDTLNLI